MGTFAANPMGIGWGRLHKAPCSISPEGPLLGRMAARPAGDLDQLDQPDPHVQPDRRGLQDRLDRHVPHVRPRHWAVGPTRLLQMRSR
jgi:hypothetical protein